MKLSRYALLALLVVVTIQLSQAQQDWTPRGIEALGQNASSRTEFSLSHSMLVLASKLDKDDGDLRRVIAGVNGVSVHSYRFSDSGTYDPGALNSVLQEYHTAGWQQLMGGHNKDGGSGQTDLWVHLENNAISNIAVLFAKENQLNFISVSGSISPIDLLHLSGHFGIPKIEGGTTVPATNNHP